MDRNRRAGDGSTRRADGSTQRPAGRTPPIRLWAPGCSAGRSERTTGGRCGGAPRALRHVSPSLASIHSLDGISMPRRTSKELTCPRELSSSPCLHLTAESDSTEFTCAPDGSNTVSTLQIRQVRIRRVTGIPCACCLVCPHPRLSPPPRSSVGELRRRADSISRLTAATIGLRAAESPTLGATTSCSATASKGGLEAANHRHSTIRKCHLDPDSLALIYPKNVGIHQVQACQLNPEGTPSVTLTCTRGVRPGCSSLGPTLACCPRQGSNLTGWATKPVGPLPLIFVDDTMNQIVYRAVQQESHVATRIH